MKLFNYLVASILLFTSLNTVRGQGISSENLVNIHNLSTSQISGLVSPTKGSLVYNIDSNKLFVFDGSIWMATATVDTTSLSNRINQRVRYSDTAAMLIGYVKKADTNSMLAPYLRKVDTSSLSNRINSKLNISDTASMLLPYTRSANSMKYTDTASMLVPYLRKVDTTSLSSRINLKLNISDTASMLSPYTRSANSMKYTDTASMLVPYLRKVDTTAMLGNYLNLASNGLTKSGKSVQLGGNLTAATTITNNSNALTIATGGSALNVTGLSSGALSDSILTVNASTGRVNRVNLNLLNKADSTTASNGLAMTGKDIRLGGALSSATSIITTGVNTFAISGLQSGSLNDSVVVADATTGALKRMSSSRLGGWSLMGNSGTTAGTNFIGTTDGIDLVFKVNNVESGRLNLYNLATSLGYGSIAAYKSTAIGYNATTGANTEAVSVGHASSSSYRSVAIGSEATTSSNNSVALGQSATASYQATAIGSTASATANNSTAIGFGATTSQANALVLGNSSAQVGIGTSTPQNALDVNAASNPLKLTGLVSGALTDSILTINASGVVRRVASSRLNVADSTTASNGLTLSSKDVRLGGALTAATTITTTATNTLSIAGLQSGSTNDSVLMITSGNVVRRINASAVAKEPFNVVGGSVQATSNTQNIYTQGNVSVGKTTNTATLDVGGKVKADSTISAPNFAATVQALSSGSTVSWNVHLGANASVTLNTNASLSITNVSAGMYGLIRVSQDGTGGRSITLPSGSRVINGGGGTVSLTQTANAVDILTFYYDGSNYWWTIGNNYN
jgi:hypothetical protein